MSIFTEQEKDALQDIKRILNNHGVCIDPGEDDCGEFVFDVSNDIIEAIKKNEVTGVIFESVGT